MKKRHPNRFVQSDIEDAERTRKWLQKADMSHEKKWIDKEKNIPAAWYAAEVLAPANGITAGRREAFQGMDRRWCAFVVKHAKEAAPSLVPRLVPQFGKTGKLPYALPTETLSGDCYRCSRTPLSASHTETRQDNAIRRYA